MPVAKHESMGVTAESVKGLCGSEILEGAVLGAQVPDDVRFLCSTGKVAWLWLPPSGATQPEGRCNALGAGERLKR